MPTTLFLPIDSKERDSGTEPCIVAHHLILAHAHAVNIYRKKYQVFIVTFLTHKHTHTYICMYMEMIALILMPQLWYAVKYRWHDIYHLILGRHHELTYQLIGIPSQQFSPVLRRRYMCVRARAHL